MGALLSLPRSLLNFLLPFTNPSTPLIQDLVHTAVLCSALYFAPQISEALSALNQNRISNHPAIPNNDTPGQNDELPNDETPHLHPPEPEGHPQNHEPPPLAPTPPPGPPQDAVPEAQDWQQQQPGRIAPEQPRPTPQNRAIGAKKAKSLARKDQRRAYHEFHRQEAELRRQREAEGREDREAALAAEKARRAEADRVIEERNRAERESKKEQERREQEEERARRERVLRVVRTQLEKAGAVDLVEMAWEEGKDPVWAERLVRASGMLKQMSEGGAYTTITSAGWAVRLDESFMREVYAQAVEFGNSESGKVDFDNFAGFLETAVLERLEGQA